MSTKSTNQYTVPSRWIEANFLPVFDIAVSFESKSIQVTMELPGVERENVQVSVLNKLIIVGGQKIIHVPINKDEIVHSGRQGGRFSRIFTTESAIQPSDIKWDLKNGIFTMIYPDAGVASLMQKGGDKKGEKQSQGNAK